MNRCTFFGEYTGRQIAIHGDGTPLSEQELEEEKSEGLLFSVKVCNKRANQTRRIEESIIDCTIWGSAADVIEENLFPGDKILIKDATAKVEEGRVTFRVNDFELI
jgi:single-stranded DNA-binding protein